MLLLFSGFGFSANFTEQQREVSNFRLFPLQSDSHSYIIDKLLSTGTPLVLRERTSFLYAKYIPPDTSQISFYAPICCSALIYGIVYFALKLYSAILIEDFDDIDKEMSSYCLKSLTLPQFEIFPTSLLEQTPTYTTSAWDLIDDNETEERIEEESDNEEGKWIGYIGSNIEFYKPVTIITDEIQPRTMKSLFSYENWY